MRRIVTTVPNHSPDTLICAYRHGNRTLTVSNTFIRRFLRSVCKLFGGSAAFGFNPQDIGNKSIRSGAAMALFLADHSPSKIMILGRWLSDAFLDYIRPQVLEWTNNMSSDMVNFDSFWDLTSSVATERLIREPINGRDSPSNTPMFFLGH